MSPPLFAVHFRRFAEDRISSESALKLVDTLIFIFREFKHRQKSAGFYEKQCTRDEDELRCLSERHLRQFFNICKVTIADVRKRYLRDGKLELSEDENESV